MNLNIRLQDAQRTQDAMTQAVEALRPRGKMAEGVKAMTLYLHRRAVQNTHVDTSALRRSIVPRVRGLYGEIYINPVATNPRGQRPAVYGIYEHRRGGSHAFFGNTVAQDGEKAAQAGIRVVVEGLP